MYRYKKQHASANVVKVIISGQKSEARAGKVAGVLGRRQNMGHALLPVMQGETPNRHAARSPHSVMQRENPNRHAERNEVKRSI